MFYTLVCEDWTDWTGFRYGFEQLLSVQGMFRNVGAVGACLLLEPPASGLVQGSGLRKSLAGRVDPSLLESCGL